MVEQANGQANAPTAESASAPQAKTPVEELERFLEQTLAIVVRGQLSTLPQIAPEVVLIGVCAAMGRFMGNIYAGDEMAVSSFRKAARTKFKESMLAVPIQKRGPAPVLPKTAGAG